MKIAIPRPTSEGETRVALIPESVTKLKKAGLEVILQAGAGQPSSYADADYEKAGARVVADVEALYGEADIVVLVHPPSEVNLAHLRSGTVLISVLNPLVRHDLIQQLADRGVAAFSLDLVPRITRAQAMDVLSSMSSIAGYKAVVLAADTLGRMFPMMMTAAGTIKPARVLILGAGVAGLQAIATPSGWGGCRGVDAYVEGAGEVQRRCGRSTGRVDKGHKRDVGGVQAEAEGDDPSAREGVRCGDINGADSGQAGAKADHSRNGARHEAWLGRRRSGVGGGRELRTDATGGKRGGRRRDDHGA